MQTQATVTTPSLATAEHARLEQDRLRVKNWKRWGPYLSERQWATVREDYSEFGNSWDYFPHDHARSRAYRWGEDGLLGITDRECRLCFALALWNERDPIMKERLYGLTGSQGNHGEDVKECYYYLDSTPTHSYMKALYKYPQNPFPYSRLIAENRNRGLHAPEFELTDTGIFDDNKYFDVFAEYAKEGPDDILIRITVCNRASEPARLHLLPTIWFRNNWSWGCSHEGCGVKPVLQMPEPGLIQADQETLGRFFLAFESSDDHDTTDGVHLGEVLFTENHTNAQKLFGVPNDTPFVKDGFHEYLIGAHTDAVNRNNIGTKAAPHYVLNLGPNEQRSVRLRLFSESERPSTIFGSVGSVTNGARTKTGSISGGDKSKGNTKSGSAGSGSTSADGISGAGSTGPDGASVPERKFTDEFEKIFANRVKERDAFYSSVIDECMDPERSKVMQQAYAGLLWSKQFYHYVVHDWLEGDAYQPLPPEVRKYGRNREWKHLFNRDLISMPDKWEYPWFAAWDLAFHMLPFAQLDPEFAKHQLTLFLREWYMHPNGQIPAYEFNFSDVNPPVHAWAVWRVYKIAGKSGKRDRAFLESAFQKLLLNFTWWVNRKDKEGNNLFSGGFLGLDNIGVFDRSRELPIGGYLHQADGTAWMAFYCLTMLSISLELAIDNPAYEDMASKFFEHFVSIADAMNEFGGSGLWHEKDGFYYDQLRVGDRDISLKTRSLVGFIPLLAVEILDGATIDKLHGFKKRMTWFLEHRKDLEKTIGYCDRCPITGHVLLSVPSRNRLEKILEYLLDENEFLSEYGIRSLSKVHLKDPYIFRAGGEEYRVDYVPGEANTYMFGGNSNWRGPIWFPINYLIVEALERYHLFYDDEIKVEIPTGSGQKGTIGDAAAEISRRLSSIFLPDEYGRRPCHGVEERFANDPNWKDLVLFYEYFHGETGRGLGADHQTGWTALVARLLQRCDVNRQRSGASS
jgi:Mannosyl oligosaccharide glucosidase.